MLLFENREKNTPRISSKHSQIKIWLMKKKKLSVWVFFLMAIEYFVGSFWPKRRREIS